ncbi:MAG: PD40 domain-containing protein [Planctomycetes bacterium]|nr:PD40 domain-containing protein [Planctomycetota bacterium]
MLRTPTWLLVALSVLGSTAFARQNPTLTINGTTSADNNAIAHMKRVTPFTIAMTGTPNAPFALLLSGEALDGSPVGESDVNTGFYLTPWQPGGGVNSPIHPVFDGIGTTNIATKLGQSSTNFVSDTPSPVFRFDANGTFTLNGITPTTAFLLNTGAGSNPIVIPLESIAPNTIALYMQVVELDPQTLALRVGNGMKVIFDPLEFPGTISYSEGVDSNVNSVVLSQRQTLARIVDPNLIDGTLINPAETDTFGASSTANIDAWLIELAGVQSVYPASHYSTVLESQTSWGAEDPNNAANQNALKTRAQTLRASGIEFLSGDAPALNNENPDFPRIELPGNRSLFCWRNGANAGSPSYGFGVLFKDTGTFRNLIPTSFGTFVGTATLSAFEWEVGVSPDGNRAVIVQSTAGADRLFILNLEASATTTITEVVNATIPTDFTTLFEESLSFVSDGQGGWVGVIAAAATSGTNLQPTRLYRFNLQGATNLTRLLPSAAAPDNGITRIDRQSVVSSDFTRLCVVAGTGTTQEQIYCLRSVTPTTHTIQNITGLNFVTLGEFNDARDGLNGRSAFSPDGSVFAFVRNNGTQNTPLFARTDGTSFGLVTDLMVSIGLGGDWDIIGDFKNSRDYWIAPDNNTLIFQQGTEVTGASSDRMEIFSMALSTATAFNLTRTIIMNTPDEEAFGPFDVGATVANFNRPTFDPAGSFRSPNGKYVYYFRDAHGLQSIDGISFDRFNLVAVNIDSDGSTTPSLELTNITGNEFEPFFLAGKPITFSEDMIGRANLFTEGLAFDHGLRHLGGSGPFSTFFVMNGRKSAPIDSAELDIDQILLFDADNPGPGVYLTSFSTSSSPVAVSTGARMSNVIPSLTEPKIAFALDRDGVGATFTQDVMVIDLENFGNPIRVTSGGAAFGKLLTRGSMHFLPTAPQGLVYAFGTVARPAGGSIDGNSSLTAADPNNPIDASAFTYRFDSATSSPIAANPTPGFRRGVMVWGVASP